MPLSTLTSKGQITVPIEIRKSLHLMAGDKVEFILSADNEVALRPVTKRASDVFGCLSGYAKPDAVTVEEMNEAIKERTRKRFR